MFARVSLEVTTHFRAFLSVSHERSTTLQLLGRKWVLWVNTAPYKWACVCVRAHSLPVNSGHSVIWLFMTGFCCRFSLEPSIQSIFITKFHLLNIQTYSLSGTNGTNVTPRLNCGGALTPDAFHLLLWLLRLCNRVPASFKHVYTFKRICKLPTIC